MQPGDFQQLLYSLIDRLFGCPFSKLATSSEVNGFTNGQGGDMQIVLKNVRAVTTEPTRARATIEQNVSTPFPDQSSIRQQIQKGTKKVKMNIRMKIVEHYASIMLHTSFRSLKGPSTHRVILDEDES
jgi:hypothetical protein